MKAFSPRQQQGLLLLLIPALAIGLTVFSRPRPAQPMARPLAGLKVNGAAARPGLYLFEIPPSPDKVLDLAGASPVTRAGVPGGLDSGWELKVEGGALEIGPLAEGERYLLGLKLDLNRASLEELTLLPNIGPVRAQGIIDLRQRQGGLNRVEDLLAVRGLGPALVESLKPLARAGPGKG